MRTSGTSARACPWPTSSARSMRACCRATARTIPSATASCSPRATRASRCTRRCTRPGVIDGDELASFCVDGSRLGTHPDHVRARASTSRPARSATASRSRPAPRSPRASRAARGARSCCMSDAECNEGSVWEAVMFAAHHRLGDLVTDRRRQRPAGARLHARRDRPLAARRALAGLRLGRPHGRRPRLRGAARRHRRARAGRAASRTSCSRRRSSAAASPTWSARSSGTTCRWTTTSTRVRSPSSAAAEARREVAA